MANMIKLTAFLVLLSIVKMCYSSSRPRPDIATVLIIFGKDEQKFRIKDHAFVQKLKETHVQFQEDKTIFLYNTWMKQYKVQFSHFSMSNIKNVASKLGLIKVSIIPPQISSVTVEYIFPSDEYYFLQKLNQSNIHVVRKEDWLSRRPSLSPAFPEYPQDEEYFVEASLRSEVEEFAKELHILKEKHQQVIPEYVIIKFLLGTDKISFLKDLKQSGICLKAVKVNRLKFMEPREYVVRDTDVFRIKKIAQKLGISDIVYTMEKLRRIAVRFYSSSMEYEFHQKLKEVTNMNFKETEGTSTEDSKTNEYYVETSMVPKVKEIAHMLVLDIFEESI